MILTRERTASKRKRSWGFIGGRETFLFVALVVAIDGWFAPAFGPTGVQAASFAITWRHHQRARSEPPPSATRLGLADGAKAKASKKGSNNVISVNRLAYRNYEVLETYEAGVALTGTEVKAIRDGKLNLRDGYVRPTRNGRSCVLHNVHIGKHGTAGEYFQHDERRPRGLLVHKHEARRLLQKTEAMGMTIVPIKAYFSDRNQVKIEIALCRGKNVRDKRATIKERDAKREERRIIKSFRVPA